MKKILFLIAALIMSTAILSAEDINFFVRSTPIAVAQFWEIHYENVRYKSGQYEDGTPKYSSRDEGTKFFSNNLLSSVGVGFEWIIWDMGKKHGSRIYLKWGIDYVYTMFPTLIGSMPDDLRFHWAQEENVGALNYTGFNLDLFFGGTFPKTDLLWGIGSYFFFTFPIYSSRMDVTWFSDYEKFAFFAAPCITLGYDIFVPNSPFKITPQIAGGITCNPVMPDDVIDDIGEKFESKSPYSGFFFSASVAFTFKSIQWRK